MPDLRATIGSPPDETVQFFRSKGYAVQSRWDQLWQQEHGRAFTVTKMLDGALLNDVRASLDKVLSQGGTFEQWKADVVPQLKAAGWYGRVEDAEITGTDAPVIIGNRRLRTIYDTNLRMSRAAGKWQRIQGLKRFAPFLMYDAVHDGRTRPLHRLWGGLDDGKPIILPVDHPAWSIYFPPCGWGCRCGVIQYSQRDLDRLGLRVTTDEELIAKGWRAPGGAVGGDRKPYRRSNGTVEMVPAGVDPGFAYNPGEHFLSGLVPPATEGELAVPAIVTGELPPMPPARTRPATDLLPRDAPFEDAIAAFTGSFDGPTDGITVLVKDRLGEPLVIDDSFFYKGGTGPTKLVDRDRVQVAKLLAEAIQDPDEIWWGWDEQAKGSGGVPRPRLTRRYVTRFDVDGKAQPLVIIMQFGEGGWRGVTAFKAYADKYLNQPQSRGGTLAYRRN